MKPKVLIVVPWRPEGEDRVYIWKSIRPYWERLGYPIVEADSGDEPFNRGRSQNLGATMAEWDVLMVLDADVIVPLDVVRRGVHAAVLTDCIVLPHTQYTPLNEEQTKAYLASGTFAREWKGAQVSGPAAGGLHIIPRAAWQRVQYDGRAPRGQDRRLTTAATAEGIDVTRLPGPILHMHHARPDKLVFQIKRRALVAERDPLARPGSPRWIKIVRALCKEGLWPQ